MSRSGGGNGGGNDGNRGGGPSNSRYRNQLKGSQGQSHIRIQGQLERATQGESAERLKQRLDGDKVDERFGFQRFTEGLSRTGWLLNYLPITMTDSTGIERSGCDLYFLDRQGEPFKASLFYSPYFYVGITDNSRMIEISNFLLRKFDGCTINITEKEDLDMPNHLSGIKHKFLKLSFNTVNQLMEAKSFLKPIIDMNLKLFHEEKEIFHEMLGTNQQKQQSDIVDPMKTLIDLREYDVPYLMRIAIDLDIRVGAWYIVTPEYGSGGVCNVIWQKDMLELCEPRILAYDIECEKSPLKFPNPQNDRIFMISYMINGQGYLIINREIVSEDIEDFEYTPKPNYPGLFKVFNEINEEKTLQRFISHIQELRPHIMVTYNGDKFDWPYVEIRANLFQLDLFQELGIRSTNMSRNNKGVQLFQDSEYTGRCIVHLDAFCWVQRDSYLPQGNQGLKSVTKYKLGYDPVEVDPEDMLRYAKERPHHMASYSVSDAVATYYLYTTYVHNFIFSLSTIIPLGPEDVLRKGSGTLCEALLMVQAYQGNIICPNKQVDSLESFYDGHLLESETYIGGHVECLEAGVFRSDIPEKFSLVPSALQQLIDKVDRDLCFTLEIENGIQRSDAINYDEVRQAIIEKLEMLRDTPNRTESPLIYHLDVGAMYPNIILTNRLQPSAMVKVSDCAACKFNGGNNNCQRPMAWTWRGEYNPASRAEHSSVKRQLSYEKQTSILGPNGEARSFNELSERDQATLVRSRLKSYAQNVYRKTKVTQIEERVSTVCMRENSFYVDTVKAFRDRRYDYKLLTKVWKGKKAEASKKGDAAAKKLAEDREVLMDSLQLAHKCILNSFYGYVMRKGARWRSMEMAGIVTHTGAMLIRQARELVEQVGRPLELDTDGIWCILPASFPNDFKIKLKNGKSVSVSYPCAMLNADVSENYTNHQYQTAVHAPGQTPGGGKSGVVTNYATNSECSIFFELDGPYKAMVLPASAEEGKLLKKKYVVFNFNGTVAELKGFELKRRGELELVKSFQSQVFECFLSGKTLKECYDEVGAVANRWLDVLEERGRSMADEELLDLISEHKTISKTVDDYEGRKSTSLTTAARLADFLGAEMIRDKGLSCHLLISRLPQGAPVTERAIPVAIFSCEPAMRRYFLRKWLKDNTVDGSDFRDVLDWDYYAERLGKTIQKIVTIPAGLQGIPNPVPRVEHPIWLSRRLAVLASGKKQLDLRSAFASVKPMILSGRKVPLMLDNEETSTSTGKRNRSQSEDEVTSNDSNDAPSGSGDAVDIEDIMSPAAASGDSSVVVRRRDLERRVRAAGTAPPSSTAEISDWLELRHTQWAQQRQKRKNELKALGLTPSSAAALSLSAAGGAAIGGNAASGVLDFTRQAALTAALNAWQIVELQPLQTPGEFLAWAMTGPGVLQRLTITVPRVFLVNILPHGLEAISEAEALGGVRVTRQLPHGRRSHALYELKMSERRWQRRGGALGRLLGSATVEGVYEGSVPLWLRAVSTLGCVARVTTTARMRVVSNGANTAYALEDMESVSPSFVGTQSFGSKTGPGAGAGYLRDASFRRVFVYLTAARGVNGSITGVVSVFVIRSSMAEEASAAASIAAKLASEGANAAEISSAMNAIPLPLSITSHIWYISGRAGSRLDSKPPLNRLLRSALPSTAAPMDARFASQVVSSLAEAMMAANRRLEAITRERAGPTIVIAQGGIASSDHETVVSALATAAALSGGVVNTGAAYLGESFGNAAWRAVLPALNEFPVVAIPADSSDAHFPAIGWANAVANTTLRRFLAFPAWLSSRLMEAEYSAIPLGNLSDGSSTDVTTTIIDVGLTRHLVASRHALWAAESHEPDIGGSGGVGGSGVALWSVWSDEPITPAVSQPGVYRGVVVELELFGLATAAVLVANELDDSLAAAAAGNAQQNGENSKTKAIEGDVMEEDNDMAITNFEGGGGGGNMAAENCGPAFAIFRSYIAAIADDLRRQGATQGTETTQQTADSVLTAAYRYLSGSGGGLLADPLLQRTAHSLSLRLFARLLATFRTLGVTVISADATKVILATNRPTVPAAMEYTNFVLSALNGRSLFQCLALTPTNLWQSMIWVSPANWAALRLPEVVAAENEAAQAADSAAAESAARDEMADEEAFARREHREEIRRQQAEAKAASRRRRSKKANGESGSDDDMDTDADSDVAVSDEELDAILADGDAGIGGDLAGIKRSVASMRMRRGTDWRGGGDGGSEDEGSGGEESADEDAAAEAARAFRDTLLIRSDESDSEMPSFERPRRSATVQSTVQEVGALVTQYWQLASDLPDNARTSLESIAEDLLCLYHNAVEEIRSTAAVTGSLPTDEEANLFAAAVASSEPAAPLPDGPVLDLTAHNESSGIASEEDIAAAAIARMRVWVATDLTRDLLSLTDAFNAAAANDIVLRHSNPALAFVKAVTHILSTDTALAETVAATRRLLLAHLSVAEFSQEASFSDNAPSYLLSAVVCGHCSAARDVDLLRDQEACLWKCRLCSGGLSRSDAERRLVMEVERMVARFLLQDLRCPRTKACSHRLASPLSPLGEPLTMDHTPESIHQSLQILSLVAKKHSFESLTDTVEQVLCIGPYEA